MYHDINENKDLRGYWSDQLATVELVHTGGAGLIKQRVEVV